VKPTPPVPEWERIATEMQLVAAQAIAGELTIDQATAKLDAAPIAFWRNVAGCSTTPQRSDAMNLSANRRAWLVSLRRR
jgi:multiple sugar transport system substrate-binding protein